MTAGRARHDRAIVFDMDDTLYPERDYVRSGYAAVATHLRQTLDTGEAYQDWLWGRFEAGQAAGAFDALNERFGLGLDADGIAELVKIYREHPPTLQPFRDIPGLLDRLAGSAALGVLSDGYQPTQRLKFEALDLADRFDAVVFTEDLGRGAWKPSLAGFEEVAAQLAVPHASCTYVGDNPAKDFIAPNALGWRTVQLRRPGQVHADKPAPPDGAAQFVLTDPGALADLLTGLGP